MCLLSCVQVFESPWTVARQALLSMGFPRQEHWNGLPFPPPGNLPDPGIEPKSPTLAGGFFNPAPLGKPEMEKEEDVQMSIGCTGCFCPLSVQ